MSGDSTEYHGARIELLEGTEVVRKRPGMWIGSTGEHGLHNLVFETVTHAVNETLAHRAGPVAVTLGPDDGVVVAYGGPGLPLAEEPGGAPGLEALLTRLDMQEASGRDNVRAGFHGVGLFVVNALSSRMTAEVRRGGTRWVREYACGVAVGPLTKTGPATQVGPAAGTEPAAGSGTALAFRPDAGIFETTWCSFDVLAEHLRELALLNRGLDLSLTDRRGPAGDRSERFHFPGGARDFVALLDGEGVTPVHPDVIGFECEDPRMAGTLEVALRWRDCAGERVRGFANSRATAYGTHLEGLRDGVAAALDAYARTADPVEPAAAPGAPAPVGPTPIGPTPIGPELVGEGLTAVVSVKLDHPEFEGSIRDVLGNHPVRACVAEAVREHLGAWLEEHPERAAAVVARILRGARQS